MRRGTYISCCSYRNHNHRFIVEESMINDLKSYLQRNWQGGIAGGIGGLIATWLYQRMGYSLTFALVDTSGLINKVVGAGDRKSTRLNSSHSQISYAVFCLKK